MPAEADSPDNPFAVFGLEPRFDLDLAELHRRYIAASAATHPDRFTNPIAQAQAAERAAALNQAYRSLRDAEARAGVLLSLWGGPGPEQDKSLPTDLLELMLEKREELEDARARQDRAALAALLSWAWQQHEQRLERIAELFRQVPTSRTGGPGQASATGPSEAGPASAAGAPPPPLRALRRELNALRYCRRLIEQAAP